MLLGGATILKYENVNGKDEISCIYKMENEKCSKAPTRISSFLKKKCKPIPSNFKALPNIFDDHQFDNHQFDGLMKITLRLIYLAMYSPWQNCPAVLRYSSMTFFSATYSQCPHIHYSLATIWL